MALHDSYARVTPFELTFSDPARAGELAEAVLEEAEARGVPADDPGAFINLGTVGSFLRELRAADAPPEAIHDYGLLVYHAVHFQEAGRPLLLVSTHVARYLTGGSMGDEAPPLPAPAGYVQLPRHLFWVGGGDGGPAEAVDGFFWTLDGRGILRVLLATGLRDDRPGLAAVSVPEAPWADAGSWLDADVRGEGRQDFATTLPGGELEGLYSFTAAGEVLKLAARVFAYVHRHPGAVEDADGTSLSAADRAPGEPAPTSLPYRKVVLQDA
jgi:hypothetical protein